MHVILQVTQKKRRTPEKKMNTTRNKTEKILGKSFSIQKNELKTTQESNADQPKDENKMDLRKLRLLEDNCEQGHHKQALIKHVELVPRNVETAEAQVLKMSSKESLESPQTEDRSDVSCLTSISILTFEIRLI